MARVFVSYRRADGLYGVGWMAERLTSLDSIHGVQTAFHDESLRAGDDFHEALQVEIASSDLLIAVIGPNWQGTQTGSPPRTLDPDDWVVREIAAAFDLGIRVVPVLLAGADHPRSSELHETIAPLSRLHAISFSDRQELNTLVEHVESHLSEIDRERARLSGLDAPVTVPGPGNIGVIVGSCAVAAGVGALLGWLGTWYKLCPESGMCMADTDAGAWFRVILPLAGAYLGGVTPLGLFLLRRLMQASRFRWAVVESLVAFSAVAVAMSIASFKPDGDMPIRNPNLRVWVAFAIGGSLLLPWTLLLNAGGASEPTVPLHRLADRARQLAITMDAERRAAVALALVITVGIGLAIITTLATQQATERSLFEPVKLIAFAMLVSALLGGTHIWNQARLGELRTGLLRDLSEVPPKYRDNALRAGFAAESRSQQLVLGTSFALPIFVAILAALLF